MSKHLGWKRVDGKLNCSLPDGGTVMVFGSRKKWFWSATAGDGQSAKYSTAFPNELAAWKSAIDFVKQFPNNNGE